MHVPWLRLVARKIQSASSVEIELSHSAFTCFMQAKECRKTSFYLLAVCRGTPLACLHLVHHNSSHWQLTTYNLQEEAKGTLWTVENNWSIRTNKYTNGSSRRIVETFVDLGMHCGPTWNTDPLVYPLMQVWPGHNGLLLQTSNSVFSRFNELLKAPINAELFFLMSYVELLVELHHYKETSGVHQLDKPKLATRWDACRNLARTRRNLQWDKIIVARRRATSMPWQLASATLPCSEYSPPQKSNMKWLFIFWYTEKHKKHGMLQRLGAQELNN